MLIAHLFYGRIVRYPSDFDAKNYLEIAQDIARNGLFTKFFYSNIRTYGYPLVLARLETLAAATHLSWQFVIFECQLAGYLIAAAAVRHAVARADPRFARWVFVTLALNLFALSYTPESLTESLSLSLVMLVAACWIRMHVDRRLSAPLVLAGTLVAAFAVMLRPANLFGLSAWLAGLVVLVVVLRVPWRRWTIAAVLALAGIVIPMMPQYANNVRFWDTATPLVVARLGQNQQIWGIENIKYATAMPPVPTPSIFYRNPYVAGRPIDPARPLAWYVEHPGAGARTLGLHVFNMLDQDLLFTYSRDLDPWYRVPLGILNHALVALALIGAVLLWGRASRTVAIMVAVVAAAHIAVHATTAVEMRFGLPLLVLAGPLAAWAWLRLRAMPRAAIVVASACVIAYAGAALTLSGWVREQAPSIRAWQAQERG